jgi:hypothetical protein
MTIGMGVAIHLQTFRFRTNHTAETATFGATQVGNALAARQWD